MVWCGKRERQSFSQVVLRAQCRLRLVVFMQITLLFKFTPSKSLAYPPKAYNEYYVCTQKRFYTSWWSESDQRPVNMNLPSGYNNIKRNKQTAPKCILVHTQPTQTSSSLNVYNSFAKYRAWVFTRIKFSFVIRH